MSYKVNNQEYDFGSIANQRITGQLVKNEVASNVTDLVEFVLNSEDGPFSYEDIENYYTYKTYNAEKLSESEKEERLEEWGEELETIEDEIAQLETAIEEAEEGEGTAAYQTALSQLENKRDELTEQIEFLENAESEPQEIYEWWIVSEYLAEKLKEKGEPILTDNRYYWGRTTTGQAILMDGVISEIAHEMGILEGQESDWSKK